VESFILSSFLVSVPRARKVDGYPVSLFLPCGFRIAFRQPPLGILLRLLAGGESDGTFFPLPSPEAGKVEDCSLMNLCFDPCLTFERGPDLNFFGRVCGNLALLPTTTSFPRPPRTSILFSFFSLPQCGRRRRPNCGQVMPRGFSFFWSREGAGEGFHPPPPPPKNHTPPPHPPPPPPPPPHKTPQPVLHSSLRGNFNELQPAISRRLPPLRRATEEECEGRRWTSSGF